MTLRSGLRPTPAQSLPTSPERRRLIATTSWACVNEVGLQRATVAEIARRAGCTPRTFWNHFADREQAVLEAVLPGEVATALFPAAGSDDERTPDARDLLDRWEEAAMTASLRGDLEELDRLGALAVRDRSLAPVVARSWEKLIQAAHATTSASATARDIIVGTAAAAALGVAVTGPIDRDALSRWGQDALQERVSGCFAALRGIAR